MAATDPEDVLTVLPWWRRSPLLRRDGLIEPQPIEIRGDQAFTNWAVTLARLPVDLAAELAKPENDKTLATAAQRDLRVYGSDPLGAAALVACVDTSSPPDVHSLTQVVDLWVTGQSVEFATVAVLALAELSAWPLLPKPPQTYQRDWPRRRSIDGRLRSWLSTAPEDALAPARAALAEARRESLALRCLTSFLLPSERAWVRADVAEVLASQDRQEQARLMPLLLDAVGDADDLVALILLQHTIGSGSWVRSNGSFVAMLDGVGFGAARAFAAVLATDHRYPGEQRDQVVEVLAHIPTDEAFQVLVDHAAEPRVRLALQGAAARFPRRAVRLLGAAAAGDRLTDLFRDHVLRHPDAVAAVRHEQPPEVVARLDELTVEVEEESVALAELLPWVLTDPPWATKRKRSKPKVVTGLEPPEGAALVWLPGEWGTSPPAVDSNGAAAAARLSHVTEGALAAVREGRTAYDAYVWAALADRADGVDDVLATWRPTDSWGGAQTASVVLALHQEKAIPPVMELARRFPKDNAYLMAPIESPEAVDVAVGWLGRRTLRPTAVAWLRRHCAYAASVLIPTAVGKAGKARKAAGGALRLLVEDGHRDVVLAAAEAYGAPTVAAVEEVLEADPRDDVPSRIPPRPVWLVPSLLPRIDLADGVHSLPPSAVDHLLTMLLLATPGEEYAGLADVREVCDRASLAAFAWELQQQWRRSGAPVKDKWVFEALGSLGNDDTVEQLLGVIRQDTSDPRVVSMLDTLVAIGSDAALLALKELGERVKTKRVRLGAQAKVAEVAERLGLSPDQLADRLVPDLGLDADGTTRLDFGPRQFTIGFDEQLRPTIADADGSRRKALPKPAASDDAELAAASMTRFRKLKKDAKALGIDQNRRLERAMVEGRRFTPDELRTVFIEHPVKFTVARRIVWATFADEEPGAACTGSFRIAEDGTFADVDDTAVELPDDAVIGVAHPLQLGDDTARWGEVLADYELLQPFPQLGREVSVPSEAQAGASTALEAVGAKVESVRFLGLDRRGWRPREVGDGGMTNEFSRPLPGGLAFVVQVGPGLYAGDPSMYPEQEILEAQLVDERRPGAAGPTFGELDPVLASEVLGDVAWLLQS